ncbi:MAG: hypothetical protein A3E52_11935 [Burkholderiales bacterium RIFCSPHIGHO2_12_FULL_63_20]|nr:MAG: hypothetical protein A3E52_11935 [Burkholderiales bacterium RIFCSPHIGHO2_12_FULL_63_20]
MGLKVVAIRHQSLGPGPRALGVQIREEELALGIGDGDVENGTVRKRFFCLAGCGLEILPRVGLPLFDQVGRDVVQLAQHGFRLQCEGVRGLLNATLGQIFSEPSLLLGGGLHLDPVGRHEDHHQNPRRQQQNVFGRLT